MASMNILSVRFLGSASSLPTSDTIIPSSNMRIGFEIQLDQVHRALRLLRHGSLRM
jgi:hypothetical protein